MGKYKCVVKCHYEGKIFRVGDVCNFPKVPPKHFVPMDAEAIETVVLSHRHDPMKPNNTEAVSALSQFVKQPRAEGFASSLIPENPIKQELKKASRKGKAK